MGAIRSQLVINDGMTSALKRINKAMGLMINNFEAVQRASGKSINSANLNAARQEIAKANAQLNMMEQNYSAINNQQNNLNRGLNIGTKNADGFLSKIKSVVTTYLGMKGIATTVGLSDTMTSNRARLELIVDDGGSVAELEQKIYASAQRSRSYYVDTMASVSKLGLVAGKAFSSNDEIIAFQELVNKNFVVGGASATEQASAMYQLTQAMGSGRLQGDEYRSIIENAPLLAKSIEDYMRNVQKANGTMKDWASEGKLTADVIKAAVFNSADEVEERFNKMPKTWGQIWTSMKNRAIKAMDPILVKVNNLANNAKVQNTINGLVNGFALVANIAAGAFEVISNIYTFMSDNWSMIGPIIMGVIAALLLYKGAVLAITAVETIAAGVKGVLAAAQMMQTGETLAATAAQHGLNAALWACPITWIIVRIIALIALFYAAVAAVNKFAGTSVSATGIICGAFMVALSFVGNILVALWNLVVDVFVLINNLVATVANFIGNVFTDPIGAVCRLFFDLADIVLGVLQALASAIDTVFGSNLAGSVQGWRDSLGGWVDETFGKGEEIIAKMNADDLKLGGFEYGEAWDAGYSFSEGIDESIANFDPSKLFDTNIPDPGSYSSGIGDSVDDIAGNTGSIADSMEITEEDLKYLRDIAERETINRFTTADVSVNFGGITNNVSSDMDLDGVVNYISDRVAEELEIVAEGVHE